MRWAVAAIVVALAAVIAVNALLLGYGGDRHDPVGRLSPVAGFVTPTGKVKPLPRATTTAADHGGRTDGSSSDD